MAHFAVDQDPAFIIAEFDQMVAVARNRGRGAVGIPKAEAGDIGVCGYGREEEANDREGNAHWEIIGVAAHLRKRR